MERIGPPLARTTSSAGVWRLRGEVALRGWTPDLALFSALLVVAAACGRPFAKLNLGSLPIYPTELALVATLILLVRRVGLRGVVHRVRDVPLAVLAVL